MPNYYYHHNPRSRMEEYFSSELERQRQYDDYDQTTKRYLWPPGVNATGRRMLFTGPDGIRNQNVTVQTDYRYVGIGTMSPEGTSDLDYLYRPASVDPPSLRPKHRRVGEIGWGIPQFADWSPLHSRQQITRGEFRKSAEDRHTHLYQNPWTPHPDTKSQYLNNRPSSAELLSRKDVLPSIDKVKRPYTVMHTQRPHSRGYRSYRNYSSSSSGEHFY